MKHLAFALFTLFCLSQTAQAAPLKVVASFSILGDMAQQVGGDAVAVKILVGPDSDTHTYQPTPADVKAVTDADLIVINGLGFEGWMGRLIQSSGYKGKIVVASEGVKSRTMDENETDPHAWQDLANGRIYAQNIATALTQALPKQAAIIKTRALRYDAEIAKMDQYVRTELAAVPPARRKIITSHDAFGYFGAAYDILFLAPVGMNTEAEPSAAGVAKLIEQIKAEKVKTVFIENMSNPKLIQQIARDSGAQMGGALYSDALSAANGSAPTYLAMFKNNVPKMKAALSATN